MDFYHLGAIVGGLLMYFPSGMWLSMFYVDLAGSPISQSRLMSGRTAPTYL